MRRLLAFVLAAASIVCPMVSAQVFESTTSRARANFLLRMQRQEDTSASCVIVYPDHRAHYEIVTGMGVQVYEGPLSAESARQFDTLLAPLAEIDPARIVHKSQTFELDLVILNVLTPHGISNLQFSDSSTRKPFKQAVEPALKWMSGSRRGLASLPPEKKDNCMPHGDGGEPAPKAEPPILSPSQARALSMYLLFRADSFKTDEGNVNESCAAVTPNGRYRYEVRKTTLNGAINSAKVFQGTIDSDEMARLREILAEPALLQSTHYPDPPNGVRARNSEIFELSIPRADHLQRLRFFSNSGLGYMSPAVAAQVTTIDTDEKLLKPIRAWLRDSIEKRKGAKEEVEEKPNHCSTPF